jgi:hypothetical protein
MMPTTSTFTRIELVSHGRKSFRNEGVSAERAALAIREGEKTMGVVWKSLKKRNADQNQQNPWWQALFDSL